MCSVLGVCIHHSQVRDSDSNEVMGSAEDRVFETNPLSLAVHIILYAYSNSCMYSCADSCNMDYVTILHVVRAKLHHLAALDLSSGILKSTSNMMYITSSEEECPLTLIMYYFLNEGCLGLLHNVLLCRHFSF